MGRVAVLGTGIMGVPIARNLLRAGNDVTGLEPDGAKGSAARTGGCALVRATSRQFDRAFDLGHGDEDMSAVYYACAASAGARS